MACFQFDSRLISLPLRRPAISDTLQKTPRQDATSFHTVHITRSVVCHVALVTEPFCISCCFSLILPFLVTSTAPPDSSRQPLPVCLALAGTALPEAGTEWI